MPANTFSPAYANKILEQQESGDFCRNCDRTEIEHTFDRDKCCDNYVRERPWYAAIVWCPQCERNKPVEQFPKTGNMCKVCAHLESVQ